MPSLVPQRAPVFPAYDLAAWRDAKTEGIRARVEKFLGNFWTPERMALDREIVWRPFATVEEYDPVMPHVEAWRAEIDLTNAIAGHAAGTATDEDVKAALVAYVESHTWVYRYGTRTAKVGVADDPELWPKVPLVYVDDGKNASYTASEIAAEIIRLMVPEVRMRKL